MNPSSYSNTDIGAYAEYFISIIIFRGQSVNVSVLLEREDEVTGSVVAPFYPQVIFLFK